MCQLERERVGYSDMPIGTSKKNGMVSRDLVEVPTCRQIRRPPQSLIPAEARDPFGRRGAFNLLPNAFAKLLDGVHSGEVDGELLKTRFHQVHVSVIETGHDKVTAKINNFG